MAGGERLPRDDLAGRAAAAHDRRRGGHPGAAPRTASTSSSASRARTRWSCTATWRACRHPPRHAPPRGRAARMPRTATRACPGRPGVVLATSGPGVINTATAAATAYADSRADADRLTRDAHRRRGPRHRLPARGQGPARRDGRPRRLEPQRAARPTRPPQAIHDAFASLRLRPPPPGPRRDPARRARRGRGRPLHARAPVGARAGSGGADQADSRRSVWPLRDARRCWLGGGARWRGGGARAAAERSACPW